MHEERTMDTRTPTPTTSKRRMPRWMIPVLSVGVVVALVVAALLSDRFSRQPAAASPVELATAFVEAYGTFDADQAASYLAADADLSAFDGGVEGLRLELSHWKAQGFKLLLDSCEEQESSPSGTSVRCRYDYHGIRSDEIGLGPYSGSWFDIGVLEGEIVSVSGHLEFMSNGFSSQMWEPFAEWVAETYPEDGAIMYENWPSIFMAQLTDESNQLWEQRSREYAATQP